MLWQASHHRHMSGEYALLFTVHPALRSLSSTTIIIYNVCRMCMKNIRVFSKFWSNWIFGLTLWRMPHWLVLLMWQIEKTIVSSYYFFFTCVCMTYTPILVCIYFCLKTCGGTKCFYGDSVKVNARYYFPLPLSRYAPRNITINLRKSSKLWGYICA